MPAKSKKKTGTSTEKLSEHSVKNGDNETLVNTLIDLHSQYMIHKKGSTKRLETIIKNIQKRPKKFKRDDCEAVKGCGAKTTKLIHEFFDSGTIAEIEEYENTQPPKKKQKS